MKRLCLILAALAAFATPAAVTAQMQALFGYSTFYLPQEDRPYMETYLQVDAWTVGFVQQPSGVYKAAVEVTLVARQQDSVVFAKKYDLGSPTVGSLDELDFSFLDVQRFALPNGVYEIELTLRDKSSEEQRPAMVTEKVVVNYDGSHPALSSLQLMADATPTVGEGNMLSRGGYDMEPYVSDFYPEQVEQLNFYYEIYNIEREVGRKPFLAMAYIERAETGARIEGMQTASRKNSAPVVPVYGSLDIKELASGNYNLVVELRNRDNQTMMYKKVSFYRSNPGVKAKEISDFAMTFAGKYTDEDMLDTYIDALWPIASDLERSVSKDIIRRVGMVEEKQAFLYRFWVARNPMAPEAEWLKYKQHVEYVQEHFSYPRVPDKPIYPNILSYGLSEGSDDVIFVIKHNESLYKGEVLNFCIVNDEKMWEKIGQVKVVNTDEENGVDTCIIKRGEEKVFDAIKAAASIRLVTNTKFTPGIHSDRGRVYLQYGPPDYVRDEKNYVGANKIGSRQIQPFNTMQSNEGQAPTDGIAGTSQGHVYYLPYQLWRYNKLETDDPNRVFLFWDEHRSGYYLLLNSNARGEVQEIGWERRLCRQQLPEDVVGEVGEQFNRGY